MIELDVITEKEDVELWISLPDYTNVGLEYGFKTSQIIERNFKDFKEKLSRKYIESYKKRYKEKIKKKNLGNHYLINNNYEFIQNKIKIKGHLITDTSANYFFNLDKEFRTLFYNMVNNIRYEVKGK